jgi:hypothetical protein
MDSTKRLLLHKLTLESPWNRHVLCIMYPWEWVQTYTIKLILLSQFKSWIQNFLLQAFYLHFSVFSTFYNSIRKAIWFFCKRNELLSALGQGAKTTVSKGINGHMAMLGGKSVVLVIPLWSVVQMGVAGLLLEASKNTSDRMTALFFSTCSFYQW